MMGAPKVECPKAAEFRLHEYDKLREEVTKRIELQQNVLLITFVMFGGFIAAALPDSASDDPTSVRANLLLLYPLLASVLANVWVRHHLTILEVAHHVIRIEHEIGYPGWESRPLRTWIHIIGDIPVFAIVMFSQLAMILVGLRWLGIDEFGKLTTVFNMGWPSTPLFLLSMTAVGWTALLTGYTLCHDRVDMSADAPWRSGQNPDADEVPDQSVPAAAT